MGAGSAAAGSRFYNKRAGLLSGGQQQMVSIGRSLLGKPRCLIMDEPSIGLAPKLFQDLLQPIRKLQQEQGMSIILVEQNVREALKVSDRVRGDEGRAIVLETVPSATAGQCPSDGTLLTRRRRMPPASL